MNTWIATSERVPEPCEVVLVFDAPRRALAQYVGHIKPDTPWNMMDGRYLSNDVILLLAEIAPHPYNIQEAALDA